MIYTVTFNPSLDYIVSVEDMKLGMTNRTSDEKILPGGKGINVSCVLKNLGIDNTAFGFVAGFTGEEIRREVEALGINSRFINLQEGTSRINVKLKSMDGMEINGQGPSIPGDKVDELLAMIDEIKSGDMLILAGSIPSSMPADIYSQIMKKLMDKGIECVVDATGKLLENVLQYHPFLIKPNVHELAELFDVTIKDEKDIVKYSKELQKKGARNVLISRAGDGAVLVAENGQCFKSTAPVGKLVNAVGAGDSMVAGFVAGYLERNDYEHAFAMGLSAGSASAFSENLATAEEIEAVYSAHVRSGAIEKIN